MSTAPLVHIDIDLDVNAAYIRLSGAPVARTVEVAADAMVDLDQFGLVVGIELLDLGAEIPSDKLMANFHVHSDVIERVRRVLPTIPSFLANIGVSGGALQAPSSDRALITSCS